MNVFRRLALGGALAGAFALPALVPSTAQAWWGPRFGVSVVVPAPVVVAPPPVYPYAPVYHFVPAHYLPNGAFVPAHWGYY